MVPEGADKVLPGGERTANQQRAEPSRGLPAAKAGWRVAHSDKSPRIVPFSGLIFRMLERSLMAEEPVELEAGSSVDKALDLLFHLHAATTALGVSQVARELGVPKPSVHRLLRTLTRRGLVEQDAEGRYQPGAGLIALGLGVLERDPVVALARPILEEEAARLGETVFLTGLRGQLMVVLDKAEGSGFLRAAPQVGTTVPLHATAVGKLALAFDPELHAAAEHTAFTDRTRVVDEASLAREIALTRSRGFASSHDEWIDGLSAVAAPVRAARDGRLVAVLAIAAASPRMESLGFDEVARSAVAAAARVEARLARPQPVPAAVFDDERRPA